MRDLMQEAKQILTGELNESNYQIDYNTVFKKVAEYYNVSPEEVDNQDQETKDKIYQTLDQCWDDGDNKVPDSCPVDIH